MSDGGSNDLPGGPARPTGTRNRYRLNELAEMLDAPVENVRKWLSDEGIHPIGSDHPEDYGVDAMEYVRLRQQSGV